MILPAFFGHKKSINLLPRDDFESSTLGVVLEWSMVFGKWAVILTQLVVMGAFLWRFTLDRSLTDLRKSIAKDTAVIKSYEQVERDFVLAQKQVTQAKTALDSQSQSLKVFTALTSATSEEIWYEKISLTSSTLSLTAYSSSLPGFGGFLTAIQKDPAFSAIRIGKIESSTSKGAELQFDISMNIADSQPKTGAKK